MLAVSNTKVLDKHTFVIIIIGFLGLTNCANENKTGEPFSSADKRAIQQVENQYVTGWLENDTLKVLDTLTGDVVLQPGGQMPISGKENARKFWWPEDGSVTVIKSYNTEIKEIYGTDSLAYSRGIGTIAFSYEANGKKADYKSTSTSLTIYKKNSNSEWKIARRMWARVN